MLESRSSHSPGTLFGFTLIVGFVLLDFSLLLLLVNKPVSILSFLWGLLLLASLLAVAFVAYWTSSLSATRYHVVDNTLRIEWGRISHIVPLTQINSIILGENLAGVQKFRGVRWPGCFVGFGHVKHNNGTLDENRTIFYATRPLQQQLLLVTESVTYGISPVDLENFADCLEALLVPEMASQGDALVSNLSFLSWSIWRDRRVQMVMVAAVLLNGALFGLLCVMYESLPALVPLHFDAAGAIDRMASPANLFVLPFLGLFAWIFNGALGWFFYQERGEQPLAYVLWGAAIMVQLTAWAALVGLLA